MQDRGIDRTDLQFDFARIMERLAERDFVPGKARTAHIDGENSLGPAQAFEPRGGGLQNEFFARRSPRQDKGDAAGPIAAGLGLRAIPVVDRHEGIGSSRARLVQYHELIESKAFAAGNRARFWPADGQARAAQIENGDLIADPIQLGDWPIRELAQEDHPFIHAFIHGIALIGHSSGEWFHFHSANLGRRLAAMAIRTFGLDQGRSMRPSGEGPSAA
jgi:hypothetical protein